MELTKEVKRELRELVGLAHERALAAELSALEGKFEAWRKGELNAFELNDEIHKFHNGASRDLYTFFTGRGMEDITVASSVAQGFLQRSELSPALLSSIKRVIEEIEQSMKEA